MSRAGEWPRVLRAFAYLRAMSLRNAVRQKLRRLQQPKYAIGFVIMAAYLGVFFVFPMLLSRPPALAWSADGVALLAALSAVFVAVAVATAWLLPGNRAALAFSEAEVAFLFPAPLTRVALINFSLLRSQVAIFASAFLLSLVFGRGRGLPGNAFQHATGLWLVMATLRLHFLGASFAHERLFEAGWAPWLRRAAGAALLLALVGGLAAWVGAHVRPPTEEDFASGVALRQWLLPVLEAPPASTVLAPFRWVVAPLFAGGSGAWGLSLLPALALLVAHYAWVVRSHVAFEEASIDRARKRAERAQAIRDGRSPFARAATARPAPFALAPRGPAAIAFLWHGLIALGAAGRPRNVVGAAVAAVALVVTLALSPWHAAARLVGEMAVTFAAVMPMFGPLAAQGALRDSLDRLDILKAMPVPGRHIVLGELLAPLAMIVAAQWVLLLMAGAALLATGGAIGTKHVAIAAALVLVTPPMALLVLGLPFGLLLWFPAWKGAIGVRGGGFEVAGQRLLFGVAFMAGLFVLAMPAAAVGGGLALLGWFLEWRAAGLVAGAVAAAAVLAGECGLMLRLLGKRVEQFDLSLE